jgi:predicted flap endonuclease-1-like 5' DNA nuclease
MWRAVTWPVRSRPVRRVLLLWLGTQVRRRMQHAGAGLWSDEEDDEGRTWWPWLLALTVAVIAAGLVLRRRRDARPTYDRPTTSTAETPTAGTADPVRRPAAAATVAATPSSPQLGVAELSRAPDELDLASGADVIGRTLAVEDLKVVEGIGPKIEQLLNDSGVHTWHDLSAADVDRLRTILQEAGSRYRMHDPSTWPQQASLLIRGDWEGFRDFSDGERDT